MFLVMIYLQSKWINYENKRLEGVICDLLFLGVNAWIFVENADALDLLSNTHVPFVYSRCWVKDDKEGWIGATVEEKSVDDNKVVLQLKTEKEDVSW